MGLAFDSEGALLVTDLGVFDDNYRDGNRLRRVLPGGLVTTVAGSGIGQGAGAFNNLDYEPGRPGRRAILGNLSALAWGPTKRDTLFVVLSQRILAGWKSFAQPPLFVSVSDVPKPTVDDTLRFAVTGVGVVANDLYTARVLGCPAGVSAFGNVGNPSTITGQVNVVIPATADTGRVTILVRSTRFTTDITDERQAIHNFRITQPVGVKHALGTNLEVYPIPAGNNVTLRFKAAQDTKGIMATWVDALGRTLATSPVDGPVSQLTVPPGRGLLWLRLSMLNQPTQSITVMRQ